MYTKIRAVPVIRLSLGRRLVNRLQIAQRINALTKWRRREDTGSLLVSSNLTSAMKTLSKRNTNFPMSEIWKILLDPQKLEPRVGDTLTRISGQFQGGSVIRLSLGRRLDNLLPVAQQTDALT